MPGDGVMFMYNSENPNYECYIYQNGSLTSTLFGVDQMTAGLCTVQSSASGVYCISTSATAVSCCCSCNDGKVGDGATGRLNVGSNPTLPCKDK